MHMGQGSELVYSTQPRRCGVPRRAEASRMAPTSPCLFVRGWGEWRKQKEADVSVGEGRLWHTSQDHARQKTTHVV